MKIYIVRHGETIKNQKHIIQGQLDGNLSDFGKLQSGKLANRLKDEKFDFVYSSDSVRAKETANMILSYHKNNLIINKLLRERNYGQFVGMTHDERDKLYPGLKKEEIYKITNVENLDIIYDRAKSFFETILSKYLDSNKSFLIIGHKHINAELCRVIEGKEYLDFVDKSYKNSSLTIYKIDGNGYEKILFNDVSFLK